jgi:hypothetical protein
MRVPLEQKDITVEELKDVCEHLKEEYEFVGISQENNLSATFPYVSGDNPGVFMSLLSDITIGSKITRKEKRDIKSFGMKIEFFLPEKKYSIEGISEIFDMVTESKGFTLRLTDIEREYEKFLELKNRFRKRNKRKVVMELEV